MTAIASSFFAALALGLSATAATHAQDIPTTAAARFAQLDRNQDGRISLEEYGGGAFFRALDTDHNYRLSAAELQAVLGPQRDGQPSVADRIRVADLNGDGELSAEEVARSAQMRFQWLDGNHDGSLDLAELQAGFGRG